MTDRLSRPAILHGEGVGVVVDDQVLLSPTSIVVRVGELWAVTGSNGAGKTTLLRALIGTRPATSGECRVDGEPVDLSRARQRRTVAALVDAIPVARDMTVLEQVGLVATSWFDAAHDVRSAVGAVVDDLGIAALTHRFPHELSSGQLQLFHLALVLVRPAEILLLDEPERHLDVVRVASLAALLRRRADDGTAIVVSTHDADLVAVADEVLCLDA